MRYSYEHLRSHNGAMLTCCLITGDNAEILARGVSICCTLDQYNRKFGNMIAKGRADKALRIRNTSSPIRPEFARFYPYRYKSQYFGEVSEFPSVSVINFKQELRVVSTI